MRVLTTDVRLPDRRGPKEDEVHRKLRWYWRDHRFPRLSPWARAGLERHNAEVVQPEESLGATLRRAYRQGWSVVQHHHRLPGPICGRLQLHPGPLVRGDWALRRFGIDPDALAPVSAGACWAWRGWSPRLAWPAHCTRSSARGGRARAASVRRP